MTSVDDELPHARTRPGISPIAVDSTFEIKIIPKPFEAANIL